MNNETPYRWISTFWITIVFGLSFAACFPIANMNWENQMQGLEIIMLAGWFILPIYLILSLILTARYFYLKNKNIKPQRWLLFPAFWAIVLIGFAVLYES